MNQVRAIAIKLLYKRAVSKRVVNSTGASPVLIKQRYGYQEFHSQPEHWKLVGFLTFPCTTITFF
ncbi:hypothetical protein [uncultured Nostoc sp.]|uniref:hypothetical protein n=1 Tax=uncultured Nostoc sp. TaxID=340711 RepID=UPI0035CB45A7